MDRKRSIIGIIVSIVIILAMPRLYAEELPTEELPEEKQEEQGPAEEPEEEELDEEDEKEPEKLWQCFDITMPEPDGQEGCYRTRPEIVIVHRDEEGKTAYTLRSGGEEIKSGSISGKGGSAVLEASMLKDGIYTLEVRMLDEKGQHLGREYDFNNRFSVDTTVPEVEVIAPNGFEAWYQDEVSLSVKSTDTGSGVAAIRYYLKGLLIREEKVSDRQVTATFSVALPSEKGQKVPVRVEVQDRAGNCAQVSKGVYVDKQSPQAEITGVVQREITSRDILLRFQVQDENGIASWRMQGTREDIDGMVSHVEEAEQNEITLDQEGIYRLELQAVDLAGHISATSRQFIIDKSDPVIRLIDELEGVHIREFRWNAAKEEVVKEFTSYDFSMTLNGRLYSGEETIYNEGRQLLKVQVKDAAGNTAEARAGFTIDRTKPEIVFDGIENGEEYEENAVTRMQVLNSEDRIEEIRINGKRIKIEEDEYQYQFTDVKEYEITVVAQDKAGNVAKEKLSFAIIGKEGSGSKILNQMKKFLGIEKDPENKEKVQVAKGSNIVWIIIAICIGGAAWKIRRDSRQRYKLEMKKLKQSYRRSK